jgi:hypothetical protein
MQLGKLSRSHISRHGSAIWLLGLSEKRQAKGVKGNWWRVLTVWMINAYLQMENYRQK